LDAFRSSSSSEEEVVVVTVAGNVVLVVQAVIIWDFVSVLTDCVLLVTTTTLPITLVVELPF
jgi:hypothetical protein